MAENPCSKIPRLILISLILCLGMGCQPLKTPMEPLVTETPLESSASQSTSAHTATMEMSSPSPKENPKVPIPGEEALLPAKDIRPEKDLPSEERPGSPEKDLPSEERPGPPEEDLPPEVSTGLSEGGPVSEDENLLATIEKYRSYPEKQQQVVDVVEPPFTYQLERNLEGTQVLRILPPGIRNILLIHGDEETLLRQATDELYIWPGISPGSDFPPVDTLCYWHPMDDEVGAISHPFR